MMKNNTVASYFTYKLKCILLVFILMNGMSEMLAAQARPQNDIPLGIFQRLIKIKYNTELYLIVATKHSNGTKTENLDSALAIYNTIRWNVDGLVYQLSGDLVAANSPKKLRRLNNWCLKQSLNGESIDGSGTAIGGVVNIEATTLKNIEGYCQEYLPTFSPIGKTARDEKKIGDTGNLNNPKNINLTTNVFYLIKDSYSLIKGLSDLKTQKTMALVEMLDQMRLASPQELLKQLK
jgi:hypothetical protein